jgi:hypothetical protein
LLLSKIANKILDKYSKNTEKSNYLLYLLIHPTRILHTVPFYAKAIKKRFLSSANSQKYYPQYIHSIYKEIKDSNFSPEVRFIESCFKKSPEKPETNCYGQRSINLACGEFSYGRLPDWNVEFDDLEQTMSMHRWNWLLTELANPKSPDSATWGIELIRSWIAVQRSIKSNMAWKSYTVGERISNCIIFLSHVGTKNKDLSEIVKSLKDMTLYLCKNLEYHPSGDTFNHILNNGRALYYSGQFFENHVLIELSSVIIKHEITMIVNDDGFTREGSSHYQFLVTRWILEIYILAKVVNDVHLCDILKERLSKMIKACWFFLVYNEKECDWAFPLIGDVSPDFTPDWLMCLPWSLPAIDLYKPKFLPNPPSEKGWLNLFGDIEVRCALHEGNSVFGERSFQRYDESGWFRLDYDNITIFWHVEPAGTPLFPSHGHCDTGSFVMFIEGEQLLIDPGRSSYIDNNEGRYGITAAAHNQITIDGYDPFLYHHRNRYPEFYIKSRPEVCYKWVKEGFEFIVSHDGFGRIIGDQIIFERTFKVYKKGLNIQDRFIGNKKHYVRTYFHWAPGLEIFKTKDANYFEVNGEKQFKQAKISISADNMSGDDSMKKENIQTSCEFKNDWFYPRYGVKEKSKTLVYCNHMKFPLINNYTLSWSN